MLGRALKDALTFLVKQFFIRVIAPPIRRNLNLFEAATHDPRKVQDALLQSILREQAATGFGRDHHFAGVRTAEEFRRNVSVAGYEAIEPYIRRVKQGETAALLADPKVYMFALTSGSTATRKYIPVTARYLADYKRSWNIWGLKVFRDHRELMLSPIVQMVGDHEESLSETGVPCGAVTGLTAQMQKRVVRLFYALPGCVGKIKDAPSKYYAVMRLALPRNVGLIVGANPSTMLNLARAGDLQKQSLIRDIHDGTLKADLDIPPAVRAAITARLKKDPQRAKELEAVADREGHLYPKDAWSKKPFLLGNWTGGSMGAYLRHYPKYFGGAYVRDLGLIASEGRMTIPLDDGTPAGVLDITSHYFEFIPESEIDSPKPTVLGAHELTDGGRYYILLTTGYGLYRYNISDVVRVAGFLNGTPRLEFLSKGSLFANITGEKLSEYHVTGSMVRVLDELDVTLGVYALAPCWPPDESEQPYYGLFVERGEMTDVTGQGLARRLDARLCEVNIEYEAKRSSGRLGPVRLAAVRPGFWAKWDRERLAKTGGTMEQYKHPCLIGDQDFAEQARRDGALAEAG